MAVLQDYRFHVGYHAGWTKDFPVDVVNRLKLVIRDEVRKVFDQELMDSWDSPRRRQSPDQQPHQHASLASLDMSAEERELFEAIEHVDHPEHDTGAPLEFVKKKCAIVNDRKKRNLEPEASETNKLTEGCLYVDHTWTKIDSFALFEGKQRWVIRAKDPVTGTQIDVPMQATLIYECEIPEPPTP